MELNFFKDILFDLINESDALNVSDIACNDAENLLFVSFDDGSLFQIKVTEKRPC